MVVLFKAFYIELTTKPGKNRGWGGGGGRSNNAIPSLTAVAH